MLVVADWRVEARAVVAAIVERSRRSTSVFRLVVPAWLHGLDWVGDPKSSIPYAEAQAAAVRRLLEHERVAVLSAAAGDPSPVAAAADALAEWPAHEVLVIGGGGRTTPFDTLHRIARATGLATTRVARSRPPRERFAWLRRGGSHSTPTKHVAV